MTPLHSLLQTVFHAALQVDLTQWLSFNPTPKVVKLGEVGFTDSQLRAFQGLSYRGFPPGLKPQNVDNVP